MRSDRKDAVIEGLKLTMTGLELRTKLDERIQWHTRNAARCAQQLKEPDPSEAGSFPQGVMEGEIEKAHEQVEILTLIRDYIIADEVYRLGEFDLRFADLLPEPDFMACGCFSRAGNIGDRRMPGLFDEDEEQPVRN